MTSPFENVAKALGYAIGELERSAQVLLFASAGHALLPSYRTWAVKSSSQSHAQLLNRAISHAIAFALDERAIVGRHLLDEIEAATPSGPSDVVGFTAAQDCCIAIDCALRIAVGEFDAADGAWYLLEPMLQATSQRLFDVSDPGSELQADAEEAALLDEALATAIEALTISVEMLRPAPPEQRTADEVARVLGAIRPVVAG